MVSWTLRRLLISLALALSLSATGGLAFFFVSLFRQDKLASIFESERSNAARAAERLAHLLQLASVMDLSTSASSSEIIFVYEDPCRRSADLKGYVSPRFVSQFAELKLEPIHWTRSIDVEEACRKIVAERRLATPGTSAMGVQILKSSVNLMIPYVLAFLKGPTHDRLAMISMLGFETAVANTLFLSTPGSGGATRPSIEWAADGAPFAETALVDTGISHGMLDEIAGFALGKQLSYTDWHGSDGLLSISPVSQSLALVSLAYRPAIMAPVDYILRQALVLTLGIFSFCLLFGRLFADRIGAEVSRLTLSAERIGGGDFDARLEKSRIKEFSIVDAAFNTMATRIRDLMKETEIKAGIDKELALAQQVQLLLMPGNDVLAAGHRVASFVKAAESVGGDWWGYIEVPDPSGTPKLLLCIGDATGHGAGSALIAATVKGAQSMLGSWIEAEPALALDPNRILKLINRNVWSSAKSHISMCFTVVLVDPTTGSLVIGNAGGVTPYLLSKDGAIKPLICAGDPLGGSADPEYAVKRFEGWEPGCKLVMYSDGLTDAMDGEKSLYDRRTLTKALKVSGKLGCRELVRKLLAQRKQAVGELKQADDITLVICELPKLRPGAVVQDDATAEIRVEGTDV